MNQKLTGLTSIRMTLIEKRTRVRFLLQFGGNQQQPDLEIEMASGDAMALMIAFQKFQALHRIPIPSNIRPQGSPSLSIVSEEDDSSPS